MLHSRAAAGKACRCHFCVRLIPKECLQQQGTWLLHLGRSIPQHLSLPVPSLSQGRFLLWWLGPEVLTCSSSWGLVLLHVSIKLYFEVFALEPMNCSSAEKQWFSCPFCCWIFSKVSTFMQSTYISELHYMHEYAATKNIQALECN